MTITGLRGGWMISIKAGSTSWTRVLSLMKDLTCEGMSEYKAVIILTILAWLFLCCNTMGIKEKRKKYNIGKESEEYGESVKLQLHGWVTGG